MPSSPGPLYRPDQWTRARWWTVAHELLLDDLPHLEHNLVVYYEDLCQRPDEHTIARMSAKGDRPVG